jgi:Family of unknown function (DUF6600)
VSAGKASTHAVEGLELLVRENVLKNLGRIILCGGLLVSAALAQDPPSRVARLNYVQGNVSMQPASLDDWSPAIVNRPFTIGDYLYTDVGARAELHMDVAVMRMGPQTSFSLLNLDDQTVQIKLMAGDMYFRIRNFGPDQVFEVDTPNAAFTLLREGIYRFTVDPSGNTSYTVVRQGQAEVTGGGQAFTLDPGNSAFLSGTDTLAYDVEAAPVPDQFDEWCSQRDYHEAHLQSVRYVSPSLIGYEDLDDYGDWQTVPTYGAVWYPRRLDSGWAPYHNGHWAWVQPWGWTWIDDAPWGFAPFHYGRWAYVGGRWGWTPGPRPAAVALGSSRPVARAQYAPALVAFFGGAHWGVSVSIGGGGTSMGWVPLGFGEVYTPPYRVSQNYFRNVNESSTVINKNVNITNVYNTTYVVNKNTTNVTIINNNQRYTNMSAPGAVTAMPQAAFAGGRPVARNAVSATPSQVAQIQPGTAAMLAPAVAPTRQALAPAAGTGLAARPPQQLLARQVIAKHAPPAAPASFAAQQSYLQQRAGQPFDAAAMHKVAPASPVMALVKQAPVAKAAVQVHAGQKIGNQAALSRPPGQSSKSVGNPQAAAQQHPPSTAPRQPARPVATSPTAAQAVPPAPKPAAQQYAAPSKPIPAAVRTQPPVNPLPHAAQVNGHTPATRPTSTPKPGPAARTEPEQEVHPTPAPAAKVVTPAKPVTPAKTPPAVHPVPPSHAAPPAHPAARPDDKKKQEDDKRKKEPQ